jgi:hypothetical protein
MYVSLPKSVKHVLLVLLPALNKVCCQSSQYNVSEKAGFNNRPFLRLHFVAVIK